MGLRRCRCSRLHAIDLRNAQQTLLAEMVQVSETAATNIPAVAAYGNEDVRVRDTDTMLFRPQAVLLLFLFFMLFLCPWTGEGRELSLESAMAEAIEFSHGLKVARLDVEIGTYSLTEAKSLYYPTLSVRLNNEYAHVFDDQANVVSVGDTVLATEESKFQHSFIAGLNYPVYDFGARHRKVEGTRRSLTAARLLEDHQLMLVKQQALTAYAAALTSSNVFQAEKMILSFQREIFRSMERLHAAGALGKLPFHESALDLARSMSRVDEAAIEFHRALVALSALTGRSYDPETIVLSQMASPQPSPTPLKPEFFPEIHALEEQIAEKKAVHEASRREMLPRLYFHSSYRLYGSDATSFSASFSDMEQRDASISLGVEWNLFSGFADLARVRRLGKEVEKLSTERAKRIAELQAEIDATHQTYRVLEGSTRAWGQRTRELERYQENSRRLSTQKIIGRVAELETEIKILRHRLEIGLKRIDQQKAGWKLRLWEEAS